MFFVWDAFQIELDNIAGDNHPVLQPNAPKPTPIIRLFGVTAEGTALVRMAVREAHACMIHRVSRWRRTNTHVSRLQTTVAWLTRYYWLFGVGWGGHARVQRKLQRVGL
jgi:hypothetical protein